jgi:transcriptional regulator with XRE-family HTH domain
MGISTPSLWDIECNDELTIYSPTEIQKFCRVLGISPQQLLGVNAAAARITANDLAALIRDHCRSRGITIHQFEDATGWYVAKSLDNPERFLHDDYSIDGIQDICRELGVDWQRFILSL